MQPVELANKAAVRPSQKASFAASWQTPCTRVHERERASPCETNAKKNENSETWGMFAPWEREERRACRSAAGPLVEGAGAAQIGFAEEHASCMPRAVVARAAAALEQRREPGDAEGRRKCPLAALSPRGPTRRPRGKAMAPSCARTVRRARRYRTCSALQCPFLLPSNIPEP